MMDATRTKEKEKDMHVEKGQLYRHNKTGKKVIVRRVVRSAADSPAYRPYSGFPEALIESCDDGPLRPRWVRLAQFHSGAMPRKSGYRLYRPA